jgi:hypothetical protein
MINTTRVSHAYLHLLNGYTHPRAARSHTRVTTPHMCHQELSEAGVDPRYIYAYTAVILLNMVSPAVLGWRVKHEGQWRLRLGRVTRRVLLVDALCDSFYSFVPLSMMLTSFIQIEVDRVYGSWNVTTVNRRIEAMGGTPSNPREYRNCTYPIDRLFCLFVGKVMACFRSLCEVFAKTYEGEVSDGNSRQFGSNPHIMVPVPPHINDSF